ncbi:hypothetical protein [Mycobacterium phage WXIN]|nr:hypothetical protein [Mycobacterium phage WXIN]
MSDRLTPFGVIDKYFYSGDDNGGPVLGWAGFHAQRIMDLLSAEGYAFVKVIREEAERDALPNGSVLFDGDADVVAKIGESDGICSDGVWQYWGSDYGEEAVVHLPAMVIYEEFD